MLPAFEVNSVEQMQQVKNRDAYYGSTAIFQRKYFDNSTIDYGYVNNNLWIIDPSDPTENLANKISNDDKDYIRSEAVRGLNNLRKNKYSFLYE